MSNPSKESEGPEIVTYKIPRIEMYQVADYQLKRLEEGYAQVGQDLTFATASLSSGLAFLIALVTATFSEWIRVLLWAIVIICGLVFLYTGARWWRARKEVPDVIAEIRRLKTDPDVAPEK